MDIALILGLAVFVEKAVEHIKANWSKWQLVAYAIAGVIVFGGDIRLFDSTGLASFPEWLDLGLTAFVLGAGSSFAHDLIDANRYEWSEFRVETTD